MTKTENPATRANASTGQIENQQHHRISPNLAECQTFLAWLRPDNHLLTAIPPDGGPTVSRHFERADDPDIAKFVEHVQKQGMGVYFSINPPATDADKKASRADIARAEWVHVDIDPPEGIGRDEGRAAIRKRIAELPYFLPRPTIVDSGNGYQALWRLKELCADLDAAEDANRAVAAALGGDAGTWNCDRILRLVGTTNFPSAKKRAAGRVPTPARLVETGQPVALEAIAAAFPPVPRPSTKPDATAAIDFAAVFACASIDDLPAGLASRLREAIADDMTLAGLWTGTPAPGQTDTSGSGFAFMLAKRLARDFTDTEIASLIYVCEATSDIDKMDERYLSRAVAKGRAAAPPNAFDEFDVVPDVADRRTASAKPKGFALVQACHMVLTDPEYLVHGLVETQSLALIFGDPGCGKSLFAIDLAACVATGAPFHGNAVRSGPVVYMAGEGHFAIRRRTAAWERHTGQSLDDAPLFFSRAAARFMDKAHAKDVTDAVDAVARTHGPPVLIVVDTLARSIVGGDENSSKDMSEFVAALDDLKGRYPDCTVLVVHHSGHGDKRRGKGSMNMKGSLDAEYMCELVDGVVTVTNTKMKDAEPPPPMTFELQPVHPSAVLVPTFTRAKKATMTSGARLALDTFRSAQEGDETAAVHVEKWRPYFYERHTGDSVEAKKKAFQRARQDLVAASYLKVRADKYELARSATS